MTASMLASDHLTVRKEAGRVGIRQSPKRLFGASGVALLHLSGLSTYIFTVLIIDHLARVLSEHLAYTHSE